jgi:hypothetical protein
MWTMAIVFKSVFDVHHWKPRSGTNWVSYFYGSLHYDLNDGE